MNFFQKIINNWKEDWNESKKKDIDLRQRIEKENEQAKIDEEDASFFKSNVFNFEIFEKNGGTLPLKSWQAGQIILNDEKKTAKIEIRQTGDRGIEENGAWYHVPYYGLGHILCENIEYKKVTTDIDGGVFLLFKDKNNPSKIKIMLNHNGQGIEIVCDKVSVLDFEDVKIGIDDFKKIDIGCKIGNFFEIKNERRKDGINEPTMIQSTKSLIESIKPKEIIYAEISGGGAMGNAGGIMLYLIKDDTLICYEANVFIDEEIYVQAKELVLKHQDGFKNAGVELQDSLFDHFYGGMGNNVFVRKNITLEINEGYFIYKKDSVEYKIIPSVQGVFNSVVYEMKNPKSDER